MAGDNIHTACAIARQCGILTPGGVALEGPEFRRMTPRQLDEVGDNTMNYLSENIRNFYHIIPYYDIIPDICVNSNVPHLITHSFKILPSLQVVARSSPHDKFLLVTRLNGHSLPKNKEEWQIAHKNKPGKPVDKSK